MIEAEAKIKINNPKEFRKKISKISNSIKKEKKIDFYYTLESTKNYPQKSLRIRKTHDGFQINFKKKLSYIKGIHAKKESEFTVSDLKSFLSLIKDFGFNKWLTKVKLSEIYEINKIFHIEINHVKNLGWFLEIEYLTDKKHITKARNEILKVLKFLGIHKKNIIEQGYTKMLWDKKFRK
ncbi:class IV adenylate cyclase [Candidatus Pacearchaeota archaeon]|nr:class IV adenylate cyclase [Candidatus Pacearchaeota archaeon]